MLNTFYVIMLKNRIVYGSSLKIGYAKLSRIEDSVIIGEENLKLLKFRKVFLKF